MATPTFTQHSAAAWTTGTGTSVTLNGVALNSRIVVLVGWGTAATVSTVADGGETYTPLTLWGTTGTAACQIFYSAAKAAGNYTVTITMSTTPTAGTIDAQEWAGAITSGLPVEGDNGAQGSDAAPTVNIVCNNANDAVLCVGREGSVTWTVGANYLRRDGQTDPVRVATESQGFTSAGTHTANWSMSAIGSWAIAAVGLSDTAIGSATPTWGSQLLLSGVGS